MKKNAKRVAVCGIFGGLALLLYLIEPFRLRLGALFGADFLKLNFSNIPIIIAGFCYGPVVGTIIVFIKTLAKCLITSTAFIGEAADLISSLTFILPATIIYHFKKTKIGAIIGLIVGTITSTIVTCIANWFIFLPNFHVAASAIPHMIFSAVLPFNIIQNIIFSLITFVIYKKISNVINKYGAK